MKLCPKLAGGNQIDNYYCTVLMTEEGSRLLPTFSRNCRGIKDWKTCYAYKKKEMKDSNMCPCLTPGKRIGFYYCLDSRRNSGYSNESRLESFASPCKGRGDWTECPGYERTMGDTR